MDPKCFCFYLRFVFADGLAETAPVVVGSCSRQESKMVVGIDFPVVISFIPRCFYVSPRVVAVTT